MLFAPEYLSDRWCEISVKSGPAVLFCRLTRKGEGTSRLVQTLNNAAGQEFLSKKDVYAISVQSSTGRTGPRGLPWPRCGTVEDTEGQGLMKYITDPTAKIAQRQVPDRWMP